MPTFTQSLRSLVYNTGWLLRPYLWIRFRRKLRKAAAEWSDLPATGSEKPHPAIFIFSRYGTETVGNQFIQLGLLRVCYHTFPARAVYLLSASPQVTEAGLAGMKAILKRTSGGVPLAQFLDEKVAILNEGAIRNLGRGDLLVLGGGPIMDDPQLAQWLAWFQWAERAGAKVLIAGCGLGPLRRRDTISLAESLLGIANVTVLRNKPDANFVRAARSAPILAPDPAFLCAPLLPRRNPSQRHLLAVNARQIGFDSNPAKRISVDEVVARVVRHALSVAEHLPIDGVFPFSTQEGVESPDSVVAARVAEKIAESLRIQLLPLPETSFPGLVDALSQAEYVLSTRMHGLILGMLLGCRSAGLDYIADNGKCADFYRDWLHRPASPSLYVPNSLQLDHFVSLPDLDGYDASSDAILNTYAAAMRQALSQ